MISTFIFLSLVIVSVRITFGFHSLPVCILPVSTIPVDVCFVGQNHDEVSVSVDGYEKYVNIPTKSARMNPIIMRVFLCIYILL